jgi:N-methylhydantoinase B
LKEGDIFRLDTPGGGGYGDPLSRPADHVLADVREGYVSAEAADRDYRVVLTADESAVDATATARRRSQ